MRLNKTAKHWIQNDIARCIHIAISWQIPKAWYFYAQKNYVGLNQFGTKVVLHVRMFWSHISTIYTHANATYSKRKKIRRKRSKKTTLLTTFLLFQLLFRYCTHGIILHALHVNLVSLHNMYVLIRLPFWCQFCLPLRLYMYLYIIHAN